MCKKTFVNKAGFRYHVDHNMCPGRPLSQANSITTNDMNQLDSTSGPKASFAASASASSAASSASSSARHSESVMIDLPSLAGQMTCLPSSTGDMHAIAGKVFSLRAFGTWNIRTIDALSIEYSNDGAIPSTVGSHDSMHDAVASISLAYNRSFGLQLYRPAVGNSKSGPKQEAICNCSGCHLV